MSPYQLYFIRCYILFYWYGKTSLSVFLLASTLGRGQPDSISSIHSCKSLPRLSKSCINSDYHFFPIISVYLENKSRLQHIQNTAARVVTLSRKSCHITPILKELHWLPVSQRIVFKLMLIVHKSFNNIAPIYISELLKVYTPSRNLRSSNMSLLKEPTSKRTWGDRSFSVAAPRLWNHLPTKLKSCHSKTRFKSLLKTHLMSQFFKDDVYL